MRCTDLAMKKLFTKVQWNKIETQAKFKFLKLDEDTGLVSEQKPQKDDDKFVNDDHVENIDKYRTEEVLIGERKRGRTEEGLIAQVMLLDSKQHAMSAIKTPRHQNIFDEESSEHDSQLKILDI